jgi:hypothetical protein
VGEQGREKMTQRHPYPEASSERNSAATGLAIGLTHRETGHRRVLFTRHVNKREPSAREIRWPMFPADVVKLRGAFCSCLNVY